MKDEEPEEELVDKKIYNQATKRRAFKFHAAFYLLAMILIWVIYAFVFRGSEGDAIFKKACIFITLFWTPIVIFHYVLVYKFNHSMLDREIKQIKKEIAEKEAEMERLRILQKKQDK